jgi:rhomboid protease GluP
LLSSALLHAGLLHVAVNGYVLLVLGGFMEKVLGAGRYAVLLGAAALGGSLASAGLSTAAVSVGASGAIWGVLGAAAALAWRPGNVIPAVMVGPLRRNAIINLVLNLSISFLPQVDLWAHLGGGVAGAALVWSGVLTRDLEHPGVQRRFTVAAYAVAGLMAAALAVAWVTCRPWQLAGEPSFVHHQLEPGIELEAPQLLGEPTRAASEPGESVWMLGDVLRDPLTLAIVVTPHDLAPEALAELMRSYQAKGPAAPDQATVSKRWQKRDVKGPPTFEAEYTHPNGLVSGLWIQLREDTELRIESVRWPIAADRWDRALERVYASLEATSPQSNAAR